MFLKFIFRNICNYAALTFRNQYHGEVIVVFKLVKIAVILNTDKP